MNLKQYIFDRWIFHFFFHEIASVVCAYDDRKIEKNPLRDFKPDRDSVAVILQMNQNEIDSSCHFKTGQDPETQATLKKALKNARAGIWKKSKTLSPVENLAFYMLYIVNQLEKNRDHAEAVFLPEQEEIRK